MSLDTTKILKGVNYTNASGETSSYTLSDPNALVKPTTAPTSQSIVSIDTNNEQQNLTLGNGLSINDNVLSATGGSSVNVVQETGTSTTDIMSQNAVTTELDKKLNATGDDGSTYIQNSNGEIILRYGTDITNGAVARITGNKDGSGAFTTLYSGLSVVNVSNFKMALIQTQYEDGEAKVILNSTGSTGENIVELNGSDFTYNGQSLTKGSVKTLTYDNTTLADHITEILGYVNTENGGNLININFKVATAVTGEMKTVTNTLSTNTLTNSSSTVSIINADEMISMTVGTVRNGSTSGKKVTFTCANDTNICSFTNVDISNINGTNVATISGQEIDFGTGTIITNYFKGIDILNVSLEHLVINYFTV